MRIESLTVFRFVAALIVVNFHFARKLMDSADFYTAGPQMVTFFFVLSGFVMSVAYLGRPAIRPADYWAARFRRIAPAYYFALAVSVILLFKTTDFTTFSLGALFLQSWVSPYALSLNSPGWSLSVEVFFYFTFPFIAYAIRKYRVPVLWACLAAGALWLVTQVVHISLLNSAWYTGYPSLSDDLIYYFPLSHWSSFCLGIAGGVWFAKYSRRDSVAFTVIAFGLAWLIYYVINHQPQLEQQFGLLPFKASLLAPIFLIFIVSLPQASRHVNKFLSLYPFKKLGEASYAMYILQLPLWYICHNFYPGFSMDSLNHYYGYLAFLIGFSLVFSVYVEGFFAARFGFWRPVLKPSATSG